jgi:predicted MPP superfamily phosphohydrolase
LKKIKAYVISSLQIVLITVLIIACNQIEVIKYEVNKNLKNKIKIVHISDLHIKRDKAIYNDLIKKINKLNPDLLLITGDTVSENKYLPLLDKILSNLNKSIKMYAILGNHEYCYKINIKDLENIYNKNNIKLLIDNGEEIVIKNTRFNLWGMDSYLPDLKNFHYKNNSINIIMSHYSKYFDDICKKFSNKEIIVLSGHTHGGQITLFGKPILLPSGCGEYIKGKYIKDKMCLFVSKGIGTTGLDIRINANPDIIFIELN